MATMKIVATTQLVVQTMGVCWVLGVGCWVYIFYVENIIKKFIIFIKFLRNYVLYFFKNYDLIFNILIILIEFLKYKLNENKLEF